MEKLREMKLGSLKGSAVIEIFIIVILLGVIAAIIVPQVTESRSEAKINTLKTNLGILRTAISLYYYQHGDRYPGQYDEADGTTEISDATDAAEAFLAQLTRYSDVNGKTSAVSGSSTYKYGPYLLDGLPENPFNSSKKVAFDILHTDSANIIATPADEAGWKFYIKTGVLCANDSTDHDDY